MITWISQDRLAATQIPKPAAMLPIRTTSKTPGVKQSNTEISSQIKKEVNIASPSVVNTQLVSDGGLINIYKKNIAHSHCSCHECIYQEMHFQRCLLSCSYEKKHSKPNQTRICFPGAFLFRLKWNISEL